MKYLNLFLFGLLFFLPPASVKAQEPDTLTRWNVSTQDGNEYLGTLIAMDSQKVILQTDILGRVEIPRTVITSMTTVGAGQMVAGEYWFENPQSTRYLWGPNGYGLRPGEGYYQNIWVFLNQVSFGIADNFSMGIGVVPLFLFAGAPTPIWITPKVSIPIVPEQFNLGVGALVGTVLGESGSSFGIAYGVTTFGSQDKNFSLGLGYGFSGGGWANAPTISLSGMIRTGKKGYFMTENYLISTGDASVVLLSLGGRRMWTKLALDFGLVLPVDDEIESFLAVPFLGLSVPFGKKQ